MATSKVIVQGTTIVDLTDATATADKILSGYTAYGADGSKITGTASSIDVSDTTATSSDVLFGKYFYDASGTKKQGNITTLTLQTTTQSSPVYGATEVAEITPTDSNQYLHIAKGYVSALSYYKIKPNSGSAVLQTKEATPLESEIDVTPDAGYDGLSKVTVKRINSSYVGSSVSRQGATTYNTSTNDQTIASGTYLTGAQTIKAVTHTATAAKIAAGQTVVIGDTNNAARVANISGTYTSDATASASDIVSGETAYVNGSKITGSLVINKYYTGSSAPSSSLGNNGDIYIQA